MSHHHVVLPGNRKPELVSSDSYSEDALQQAARETTRRVYLGSAKLTQDWSGRVVSSLLHGARVIR